MTQKYFFYGFMLKRLDLNLDGQHAFDVALHHIHY